jgi:uncharacterized integral membrane protein
MYVVSCFVIPALTIVMMTIVVVHRLDFVAFGAVFFLSQLPVIVVLLARSRRKEGSYASA